MSTHGAECHDVKVPKTPRLRAKEQLSRDCASRFGWNLHGITARRVASAGTSVRSALRPPRMTVRSVFLERKTAYPHDLGTAFRNAISHIYNVTELKYARVHTCTASVAHLPAALRIRTTWGRTTSFVGSGSPRRRPRPGRCTTPWPLTAAPGSRAG
eukprot:scaffold121973_cov36-Phaeocystis_antarctica.AAC.1